MHYIDHKGPLSNDMCLTLWNLQSLTGLHIWYVIPRMWLFQTSNTTYVHLYITNLIYNIPFK